MSNHLFSGLEQLGLTGMSDMDVFDSDDKKSEETQNKEPQPPKIVEEDLLYDKSYTCPVCDNEFKAKTVRAGKARMLSIDTDLRPKYQGIDPVKYDAIVCNKCGYAALSRFFSHITMPQAKLVTTNISPNFKGLDDKVTKYTYDDAILRHRLALVNSVVKKGKTSERAYTCLKLAWLLRGKAEQILQDNSAESQTSATIKEIRADEQEFIENACEGFKEAMAKESFPICGMDESTFLYLTADLARKCKDYPTAYKLLSEVLTSRTATPKIKDRARDLKELIKQERGEE